MLCEACQTLTTEPETQPSTELSDQLCSRCGQLIGREETEKRARKKHSQLEKFGLAGKRQGLLKPKDRRR